MTDAILVAVYFTAARADAAMDELEAAGLRFTTISQEPAVAGSIPAAAGAEDLFWSNLFGGEPDHGTAFYSHSVRCGAYVVTVNVPAARVAQAMNILQHNAPIDISDRSKPDRRVDLGLASVHHLAPMPPRRSGPMRLA